MNTQNQQSAPIMKPSLDQQRAAFAWKSVEGCSKEYMVLAKGAGALIMSNGLMATLAYYESKGKDHHKALLKHINDWLHKQNKISSNKFFDAMTSLHESNSADYRAATQEALDLLRWIRQFASAVNAGNSQGKGE